MLILLPSSTLQCQAGKHYGSAAACIHLGWAGAGGGTPDHGSSGKEGEEDTGTGTSGSGPAHECRCKWSAALYPPTPESPSSPPTTTQWDEDLMLGVSLFPP